MTIWAPWLVRIYKITNGEIILLEKYYIAPMDYGVLQVGLSNWWMCWGNPRPEKLLGEISGTINTVNYKYKINEMVNNLPKDAFIGNNKKDIYDAFISIHDAYEYACQNNIIFSFKTNQKIYYLDNTTYKKFKILDKNFKKTAALRAYFIRPSFIEEKNLFSNHSLQISNI